mgnify:CR=1 FL=1
MAKKKDEVGEAKVVKPKVEKKKIVPVAKTFGEKLQAIRESKNK